MSRVMIDTWLEDLSVETRDLNENTCFDIGKSDLSIYIPKDKVDKFINNFTSATYGVSYGQLLKQDDDRETKIYQLEQRIEELEDTNNLIREGKRG